jgi:hypothetical protein
MKAFHDLKQTTCYRTKKIFSQITLKRNEMELQNSNRTAQDILTNVYDDQTIT